MLTREADVVELERQRTLRQSQERADEALEAAQRSQHLLQRQEASAAMEAQALAAVATSERSKKGYQDMLEVVRADGEKAAAQERARIMLAKIGAEKPGVESAAAAMREQMDARLEKDVLDRVTISGKMQDRELTRLAAATGGEVQSNQNANKGYTSE